MQYWSPVTASVVRNCTYQQRRGFSLMCQRLEGSRSVTECRLLLWDRQLQPISHASTRRFGKASENVLEWYRTALHSRHPKAVRCEERILLQPDSCATDSFELSSSVLEMCRFGAVRQTVVPSFGQARWRHTGRDHKRLMSRQYSCLLSRMQLARRLESETNPLRCRIYGVVFSVTLLLCSVGSAFTSDRPWLTRNVKCK
ncbi:hypothetical protein PHSY_006479 [Pseudozyma hubeiensis SY62]|uniref:Uncharacterized protein n=1 Tax=Pseudozyma hubeiensis (strain SY62) TaxID=1305764 RepID=R9PC22_PSEHS|nr:hypothetical protein PHSY_006479 [Pseudozyma hubeiensis SY62]GAC98884.1 hypothetical protein PHSY_006479 [Pseudozyma hubeiensis SY62]